MNRFNDDSVRVLANSNIIGIVFSTPSGEILDANDEFLRFSGYSREDLRTFGLNWKELTAPESLPAALEASHQALSSGKVPAFESEWIRKDGSRATALIGVAMLPGTTDRGVAFVLDVTERKQTERELDRLMMERIAMLDSAADGIFGVDRSGTCTFINRAAAKMLGYLPGECLGQNMYNLVHFRRPDGTAFAGEECPSLTALPEEQVAHSGDGVLRRKDGTPLRVDHSVAPIVLHGRVEGQVVSFKDNSSRKEAEERLWATEERFRSAFAHAAAGLFITDLEGRFLEVNNSFCNMLGRQPSELLGTSYQAVAHPEDQERDRGVLAELVHGKIPGFVGQERFIRNDGNLLQTRISVALARDAGGKPVSVVCLVEDITEQLRAEAKLKFSEERYRSIVENTHEGICMCDAQRRITYSNPRLAEMLGHDPGACLECAKIHFDADEDESRRRFAQRQEGISESYETRLRRKDGTVLWTSVSSSPLPSDEGGFSGALCMFSDITRRRKLEEQLQHSQKMEAMGRLAGGIAHDFNNLLTVILGYAGVLERKLASEDPLSKDVIEIRKAGERAAALTQKLLAFSRKQVQTPRVFALNGLIRESQGMLQRVIGEEVQLVVALDPAAGNIKVDNVQMEQVLMNLSINSRDAMPAGGRLTIETKRQELDATAAKLHGLEPGVYAVLNVSDTGCGMDEQTKAKIFEPFFTTKGPGIGTGLGLSTVLGIVNQSGGAISVYSELNFGTCFKIYLPQVDGPATALDSPRRSSTPAKGEQILVVEDDAGIRMLAASVLREQGYLVLEAESGEAALALGAALESVDLLLTDIVMRGINGRKLAEQLMGAYPHLRVLFMSGYTDSAITQQGVLDPGSNFLAKPFQPEDLLAKIAGLLRGTERRGRILIVDDDAQVRTFLSALLEADGYTVMTASNGKEAQACCRQSGFDLVITDLVMPDQEGLEMIHAVRKNWPHLPIVAISGAFGGAYLDLAKKLGAAAALRKPFEPGSILREVHRLLGLESTRGCAYPC
ncbi:MAG TPA: PAS domain S-box protein [Bryobacteraceae bacterium]